LRQIPREAQPVSTPAVHEYGPYTLYDLDALPEDGKRYELADGWLTELSPSPWHDHGAERLKEILKAAAAQAGADVYVAGGPNDVSTPAGIRKPDVFVVPKDVARSAIGRRVRTYYASDLLLVAAAASGRTASRRSGSTRRPGSRCTGSSSWTRIRRSRSSLSARARTSSSPRSEPGTCSASRNPSPSASTRRP
jgi:hypothetical protein